MAYWYGTFPNGAHPHDSCVGKRPPQESCVLAVTQESCSCLEAVLSSAIFHLLFGLSQYDSSARQGPGQHTKKANYIFFAARA